MEETEGVLGARQGELTLSGCRVRVPACRSCLIKTRPEGRCGISRGKERGQRPRSQGTACTVAGPPGRAWCAGRVGSTARIMPQRSQEGGWNSGLGGGGDSVPSVTLEGLGLRGGGCLMVWEPGGWDPVTVQLLSGHMTLSTS